MKTLAIILLAAATLAPAPTPVCEGGYDAQAGTNFGRCPDSAPKTSTGSIPESGGTGGDSGN